MMHRRAWRSSAIVFALALLVVAAATPTTVLAAEGIVAFEAPSATSTFPTETSWRQAFRSPSEPIRVELMTRLEGTETWLVQEVPFTATAAGAYEVAYTDLGFQLPNSRLEYRFRVTPEGGAPETGPVARLAIDDERVDWQTLEGDVIRLHWQAGDESFARRALRIAEDSVAETAALLGVTETEPIDFFVYADDEDFQSALGPGTKEFVAGRAIAEIRTLFAEIKPTEIGSPWLSIVVPHELAHLVFDTATANPYHPAPHWMNEGLATYLSEGYSEGQRQRVANAIDRGTLLPLASLTDGFPSDREELFYLGYAEGASAIDFFVRTYGQERLVQLIRSYGDGVTDDEAFEAATGEGFAAFESAWLADVGADVPKTYGPTEARPGRAPVGWAGGNVAGPSETPPDELGSSASGIPPLAVAVALIVALGLVLVAVVMVRGRRRLGGEALPATDQPEPAPAGLPTPPDGPTSAAGT